MDKGKFEADLALPFAEDGIRTGFPCTAQDYIDKSLDFNKELVPHPSATSYAKVSGQSMKIGRYRLWRYRCNRQIS